MLCVKDGRECGWGVAIVTAAFMISFIRDGIRLSFGMFFVVFTGTFHKDAATTAWIGSLMAAALNFSAPACSIVVSKFGSRCSTVGGGLLCFLGFIISAYVPNIYFLYFSLGLLTVDRKSSKVDSLFSGFGLGLSYLAQTVIVVKYFKANRSLAIAAAACGSGTGGLFFSLLMDALTEEYSWSGIMLIMSGVMLQACIAGTMMKPKQTRSEPDKHLYKHAVSSVDTRTNMDDSDTDTCRQDTAMLQVQDNASLKHELYNKQDAHKDCAHKYSALSHDSSYTQKEVNSKKYSLAAAESPKKHCMSADNDNLQCSVENEGNQHAFVKSKTLVDEGTTDVDTKDSDPINNYYHSSSAAPTSLVGPKASGDLGAVYGSLLKDGKLYMFVVSQFLLSGGFLLPFTFVPTTAITLGYSQTQAAWLLTASSITSIVARLPIGVLGDRKFVNRSYLYTATFGLLSLTCLFLAFARSYVVMVILCCIYGAGAGAIVVLVPVVITDIFGDSRISEVFGLAMFGRGPGGLLILPLAGYILDQTRSTRGVYVLAACAYCCATLVTAACVYKHRQERQDRTRT